MLKIAPEGIPFVAGAGILTAAVLAVSVKAALLPLILTAFMLYFFRDPERTAAAQGEGLFICPADGRIIVAETVTEQEYLGAEALMISIFMSPFNVHVNRAPCDCTVKRTKHTPGRKRAAFRADAPWTNEKVEMLVERPSGKGDILLRQVAGFVARRIVCRAKEGDTLLQGQRFGIIKFGSRVDLYLPPEARVRVKLGDRVRAGETVLAVEAPIIIIGAGGAGGAGEDRQ